MNNWWEWNSDISLDILTFKSYGIDVSSSALNNPISSQLKSLLLFDIHFAISINSWRNVWKKWKKEGLMRLQISCVWQNDRKLHWRNIRRCVQHLQTCMPICTHTQTHTHTHGKSCGMRKWSPLQMITRYNHNNSSYIFDTDLLFSIIFFLRFMLGWAQTSARGH